MNVERLKVRLPNGVTQGQTIRLRGKGGVGVNGAPSGDLLLTVHFDAHRLYETDGHNLRMVVPLTVLEAMTGAKVKVPTPDGAIRVSIPAKSTSGTVMRIKGRGLPRAANGRGDLHLLLQVALPEDGEDARAHAKALDALYDKHPRDDWD